VAQHLQEMGFDARALLGGYNAWKAEYPIDAKLNLDS
jgi:rhodanese-related sulfurtransferase